MINTAVIPVPKLENDFYDWYQRHESILDKVKEHKYDLIFIGDSITHFFAGHPGYTDRGDDIWNKYYSERNTLNLGFGWDRTQNVLWRLSNGEFAGQTPRLVVLNIGTNNTSATENARANTPEEILEGIKAVCHKIWAFSPKTHILLMALFPRDDKASERRKTIAEINQLIKTFSGSDKRLSFMDIGAKFLDANGEIILSHMPDKCHPGSSGYKIWAEEIEPVISSIYR